MAANLGGPFREERGFGIPTPVSFAGFGGLGATADRRGTLERRFTTDVVGGGARDGVERLWDQPVLGRRETEVVGGFVSGATGGGENQEYRMLLQQKQRMVELRRQQMEEFQAQQRLLEMQNAAEEEEMRRIARNLDRMALNQAGGSKMAGHSEPTTPPEFRDGGFGVVRPKVLVSQSVLGTPPTSKVPDQLQLITPPAEDFGSKSGLSSRRNSDENEDQPLGTAIKPPFARRNSSIRNSLGGLGKQGISRFGIGPIGQINTDFLNDDGGSVEAAKKGPLRTPGVDAYLREMDMDGNFPILTSSGPDKLSASSAALDLAHLDFAEKFSATTSSSLWGSSFTRTHRPAQHSLPANSFPFTSSTLASPKVITESPAPRRYDRSISEFILSNHGDAISSSTQEISFGQGHNRHASLPKLTSSLSTSNIPTLGSPGTMHTHQNGNFGPGGGRDRYRHNRVGSMGNNQNQQNQQGDLQQQSQLQTSMYQQLQQQQNTLQTLYNSPMGISMMPTTTGITAASMPATMYPSNFNPMGFNYPTYNPQAAQMQNFQQYYNQNPQIQALSANMGMVKLDNQGQGGGNCGPMRSRRGTESGEVNRFANSRLEDLTGQIYGLCKDQHGCRYLQKKLEEGNPAYVDMIFQETHDHVVELMTDPFGNYLCQKLLEHTNQEQRTTLVRNASSKLVSIALNQHGTRALQKMIEALETPEQINIIVNALREQVVELIKDLNGNHVIQKCLNRLKPNDAQFIFDAVGENCIIVGTHRHGCCVLQRCIDHASGNQKNQLIQKITANSTKLVQDAFGNYVVQYILDLGDSKYSEPVIMQFRGQICHLGKQKFSSNVIEKCIRVAEPATRKILISEIIESGRMEEMLRDSFGNYVVQTAIDYSDAETRDMLVDVITPLIPNIRSFPYGRRIQSKLAAIADKSTFPAAVNGSPSHPRNMTYTTPGVRPTPPHATNGTFSPTGPNFPNGSPTGPKQSPNRANKNAPISFGLPNRDNFGPQA